MVLGRNPEWSYVRRGSLAGDLARESQATRIIGNLGYRGGGRLLHLRDVPGNLHAKVVE